MYRVDSSKAEEFIHHGEITASLAYAAENAGNRPLLESMLPQAAVGRGHTHPQAQLLRVTPHQERTERILAQAPPHN